MWWQLQIHPTEDLGPPSQPLLWWGSLELQVAEVSVAHRNKNKVKFRANKYIHCKNLDNIFLPERAPCLIFLEIKHYANSIMKI